MPTTDFITVKITCVPGRMHEIALNGGRKVSDAISVANEDGAELTADGYDIKVQGATVTEDHSLSDGNVILLVRKIKGN